MVVKSALGKNCPCSYVGAGFQGKMDESDVQLSNSWCGWSELASHMNLGSVLGGAGHSGLREAVTGMGASRYFTCRRVLHRACKVTALEVSTLYKRIMRN